MDFTGMRAVVTGASSGIGEVFARELAARGANLVLVARSESKLVALAAELRAAHSITADVIACDLAAPGAAARLVAETTTRDLQVDVLINNAGFGLYGALAKVDGHMISDMVAVNVASLVDLTHAYLPGMLERDRGAIVNVASTAAFQPVPYMAVYGATKAFVLSFTEALWAETRETGVRVTTLCPGATKTGFFEVAGEDAQVGAAAEPKAVVETALHGLDRRRATVISGGFRNKALASTARLAPRQTVARIAERTMRVKA